MSVRISMIALLLHVIAVCPVQASVLFVDDDATVGGDGLSWETAFNDLQLALDVAKVSGSGVTEIRIAGGTYRPTWRAEEDTPRTETFELIKGVTISGGYRGCPGGNCTGGDPNERDWNVYETILSGDLNGDDVEEDFPSGPSRSDNVVHVVYHPGMMGSAEGTVLTGCTVTGGNADGSVGSFPSEGGGFVCSQGSPSIMDCVFRGNSAEDGGAIWCEWSTLTIRRCQLVDNYASDGGGAMWCELEGTLMITSCQLIDNYAGISGGAIGLNSVGLLMTDCDLEGNEAWYGGAMDAMGSGPNRVRLTGCVFSRNVAGYGGAFEWNSSGYGKVWLTSCVFLHNTAQIEGGALSLGAGTAEVTYCLIEDNTARCGAGLSISFENDTKLEGCAIRQNRATSQGGGVMMCYAAFQMTNCTVAQNEAIGVVLDWSAGDCTITNSILWGNTPTELDVSGGTVLVSYTNVAGGWEGTGNLDIDPVFAFEDDLHLTADSPCVDAGTNTPAGGLPSEDLDGNPVPMGTSSPFQADMGAYEFNPEVPCLALSETEVELLPPAMGSDPEEGTLQIRNAGGGVLNWQIAEDCPWLTVVPSSGTSTGEMNDIRLIPEPSAMSYGRHECELVISDSAAVASPSYVRVVCEVNGVLRVPAAYATIQDAIDASLQFDEIVLADGVYSGSGNRDLDFSGKAIILRSENGPDHCIIDCTHNGRGFHFQSGEGHDSVVDGLTITNGLVSESGGALLIESSSPTIRNCRIIGNEAIGRAGAVYSRSSSPLFENCLIAENHSESTHAAIYSYAGAPVFTNCTISRNTTPEGCFIYTYGSTLVMTNCILWGNEPAVIEGYGSGVAILVSHCDIEGGWEGEGNIDVDPGFALVGDYHLAAGSPCIDAGTNNPEGGLAAGDLDGNLRSLDGDGDTDSIADMGAFEYNPGSPSIALSETLVEFAAPEGGADPDPYTVEIRNTGGGTLAWSISEDCAWLDVSPASEQSTGETDTITLSPSVVGLSHGVYEAVVSVNAPGAVNTPQVIRVVLNLHAILHVPVDYTTIQEAIDANAPGGTVVVSDGVYTGPGNKNLDLRGKTLTVRSENGPSACIIDCEHDGRGFYLHSDEQSDSVIEGLTVCNGEVDEDDPVGNGGGGILCFLSSPVIRDCIISDCRGIDGGGIHCSVGEPTITGCSIRNNTADSRGGGVYGANVVVEGCEVNGNTAHAGGGIYCSGIVTISRCRVYNNDAVGSLEGGGGICLSAPSGAAVDGCAIEQNTAVIQGGGISCDGEGWALFTNCVVAHNAAVGLGGGGFFSDTYVLISQCTFAWNKTGILGGALACRRPWQTGRLAAANCILWGNSPDGVHDGDGTGVEFTYSDVQGGWPGEGNIDADPKFALNNDHHLLPDSPCIDSGANDPLGGLPPIGADGTPRPLDGNGDGLAVADMGAFEFDPMTPVIALDEDGFEFTASFGGTALLEQTTEIRNVGGGFLDWQVIEDCTWLTAAPTGGRSSGEIDVVTLTVDASGLEYGCYDAVVEISDPTATNSPREINVTLHVYATLHVPSEYGTFQAAIDAAEPYDHVLVADGVYTGSGNRNLSFRGKPITVRSENGAAQCIIDCEQSGRGFCFDQGEGSRSILDGFTIRNGFVDSMDLNPIVGAGIYCDSSDPTIRNCVITNNVVSGEYAYGGGIYFGGSFSLMTGCVVSRNTVVKPTPAFEGSACGGGIGCGWASPVLEDCLISSNSAAQYGGGVFSADGGSYMMERCLIVDNTAARGGGLYSERSGRDRLNNCIIAGNSSGLGAGLYYRSGTAYPSPPWEPVLPFGYPVLRNCTMVDNSSLVGGGVHGESEGQADLANCVIWANTPQSVTVGSGGVLPKITYSNIAGGWEGEGNIDADPLFVDPDGPDDDPATWEDNDYRLSAGSPCIDAGSNLAVPLDERDLDADGDTNERIPFDLAGYARFVDDPMTPDTGLADPPAYPAIVDMGAYEFQALPNDCNDNGIPDDEDIASGYSEDCDSNGIPDECELCGDLNDDGSVDYDDYTIFLAAFGGVVDGVPPEDACCDADDSGDIGMADFGAWLACYRDFIGDPLADAPTAPTDPTDEGFSRRKPGESRTDRKARRSRSGGANVTGVEAAGASDVGLTELRRR